MVTGSVPTDPRGAAYTAGPQRKWANAAALALLVLFAVLYSFTLNSHWRAGWDSAIYISLARSLAAGEGYKYMGYDHAKFVPLFPLMLAGVIKAAGVNYLAMRVLEVAFAIGSLGLCYTVFGRLAGRGTGLAVMIATGSSYALLDSTRHIQSDVPFLFFSLLAVHFLLRDTGCAKGEQSELEGIGKTDTLPNSQSSTLDPATSIPNLLGSVLSLVAAFYTRSIGVTLFGGAVAFHLVAAWRLRKIEGFKCSNVRAAGSHSSIPVPPTGPRSSVCNHLMRAGVFALAMVFCVALWTVRGATLENLIPCELREGETYVQEFFKRVPGSPEQHTATAGDWLGRAWQGPVKYATTAAGFVLGMQGATPVAGYAVVVVIAVGFLFALARRFSVVECYTVFYALLVIAWPARPGYRYLLPLLPMIFYYLLLGLNTILEPLSAKFRSRTSAIHPVAIATVLLVCANVRLDSVILAEEQASPYYTKQLADFFAAIEWTKEHTSPESVVISDLSPYVYHLSGRRCLSMLMLDQPEQVLRGIERYGSWVIYTGFNPEGVRYLLPVLRRFPERFEEAYRAGSAVVYRLRQHGPDADERPRPDTGGTNAVGPRSQSPAPSLPSGTTLRASGMQKRGASVGVHERCCTGRMLGRHGVCRGERLAVPFGGVDSQ